MNHQAASEALASIEPDAELTRCTPPAWPLAPAGTEASPSGGAKPDEHRIARLTTAHLDAVMRVELAAYAVPWTRGNFVDSLASGYTAMCLVDTRGRIRGYCVAMQGAGELHLLNLTVAPDAQRRGHARHLLDTLVQAGRQAGLAELWLEVRASNVRARNLYQRYGMVETGIRKAYYPTQPGPTPTAREDAVVMNLHLCGNA